MKNYWIVRDGLENWRQAFASNGIWGLEEKIFDKVFWLALQLGDVVLFYVTGEVKGVVGYGIIRNKFYQDVPLWPAEIKRKQTIWPLRFEFDVEFVLPEEQWLEKRLTLPYGGEFRQPLILKTAEDAKTLLASLRPGVSFETLLKPAVISAELPEAISPNHRELQNLLLEIGKLQRYIANTEYPMGNERLDVVWRRLQESVPTYVFEIQVGGGVYHALGKLKHSHDIWNSSIFLVASHEEQVKVKQLLLGTFHELRPILHIVNTERILQLHKSKVDIFNIEKEMGLIPQ